MDIFYWTHIAHKHALDYDKNIENDPKLSVVKSGTKYLTGGKK